jgi:hypothetical protein
MTRIIRKTIAAWQRWRFYRVHPVIRELDRMEAIDRRKHKPTKHYEERKKRIVLDSLRGMNAGR